MSNDSALVIYLFLVLVVFVAILMYDIVREGR